jgi:hypothetical protein
MRTARVQDSQQQRIVAREQTNTPPEPSTHPALKDWAINRKLATLEKNYKRDQEKNPAEIDARVRRLKQYLEEMKAAYETEIASGRFANTADLWAAVYATKILPSVSAKSNSLAFKLAHRLWLTGGGRPEERAAIEESRRELARLRAELESELLSAHSHVEDARLGAALQVDVKEAPQQPLAARELFVCPRLVEKGWSIHDWAKQSGVDFHTADDYLKGRRRCYPSTRKKLADSLGVGVVQLPD